MSIIYDPTCSNPRRRPSGVPAVRAYVRAIHGGRDCGFDREILVYLRSMGFREPLRVATSRRTDRATPIAEQAPVRSAWAGRIHEFREYIQGLSSIREGEQLVSPELTRDALKLWWKLYGCSIGDGDLSVPDVGSGHDGEMIFIWKRDDHYLSTEMRLGAPAEFFYRNHRTGLIWEADFRPSDREVPRPIVEKLSFFLDNE